MLEVRDLHAGYGRVEVLRGVSFRVGRGEIVVLIGPNGAGKTTTLKAVAGLLPPRRGTVLFEGRDVAGTQANRLVRAGIALVPEGRMVFPAQTVRDTLLRGAFGRRGDGIEADIERHFARFPILRERQRQPAGTLSGGVGGRCLPSPAGSWRAPGCSSWTSRPAAWPRAWCARSSACSPASGTRG